jgi:hypothetical protein
MASTFERVLAIVIGASLAGLVSGCDTHKVRVDLSRAFAVITGRAPDSKDTDSRLTAEQEKLREDAQLLHEMFQVVLLREPFGPDEFGAYVNSLSQGGSLEGIYNGFVNSEQYHKLEDTPAAAYPATVKVFSQLVSQLQRELENSKAKSKISPSDLGVRPPYEPAQYEKLYAKAPFYALKRILGNEALKVVEAKLGKGDSREELSVWYSRWVTQMASMNVDFGLALRNKPDPEFHRQWVNALRAQVVSDRVNWEVLNRIHRVLNATEASASQKKGSS